MLSGRPDPLAFYTLEGRADYRDMTSAFMEGIDLVQAGSRTSTAAFMCREKAPDACHRTLLVCLHLHTLGRDVRHIIPGQPDFEFHPILLERLMRRHRLDDPEQAVDAQSAQAAYQRRG